MVKEENLGVFLALLKLCLGQYFDNKCDVLESHGRRLISFLISLFSLYYELLSVVTFPKWEVQCVYFVLYGRSVRVKQQAGHQNWLSNDGSPEISTECCRHALSSITTKSHQNDINPFTPDDAKSKIVKFSKITNWGKSKNKQHHS